MKRGNECVMTVEGVKRGNEFAIMAGWCRATVLQLIIICE